MLLVVVFQAERLLHNFIRIALLTASVMLQSPINEGSKLPPRPSQTIFPRFIYPCFTVKTLFEFFDHQLDQVMAPWLTKPHV